MFFRFKTNPKVILTLHGSDINIESSSTLKVWLTQKVLKQVDHIIFVNEKMVKRTNRFDNISVLLSGDRKYIP